MVSTASRVTTWKIDPAHSTLGFAVRHLMVSNVRGRFTGVDGQIEIDEQDPTRSTAHIEAETATVDTGNADRDTHLRSTDFFDAETYPLITFDATSIEPAGGSKYRVTGNLTLKGVARPVALEGEFEGEITDPWGGTRRSFTFEGSISRKDWGLNWNVALEAGGVLVGDKVKLTAEVETVLEA